MTRALDLRIKPAFNSDAGLEVQTFTYDHTVAYASMRESVYLALGCGCANVNATLTPDEARVLANQLLQVADQCDENKARRESLEEIEEQLRDPDFDSRIVHYVHPDVVYAAPGQMAAVAAANPGKLVLEQQPEEVPA